MKSAIPDTDTLRERLLQVRPGDIAALSVRSKVPYGTLRKIRSGETRNPRIDTVRRLWRLLRGGGA